MAKKEQVHSRINALMALHRFMTDANIKSGSNQAKSIINMWEEGNMPYTKQYPKDFERAFFTESQRLAPAVSLF